MAEQPRQSDVPITPVPHGPVPAAARWQARDLSLHLAEQHVSMAVLEAAMQQAGTTSFASPAEADALVESFMKRPIAPTEPRVSI